MRWILLCALVGALGMTASDVHSQQAAPVSKRAHDLHFRSIVLDTHDDTTQRLVYDHFDLDHLDAQGSIDFPRMRAGGLSGIFFSIYTPGTLTGPAAVKAALDQIDAVRQQVWKHPQELALCTTAAEVRAAHAQGKIAALLGLEGGHMIDNDLGVLRSYAALGVRYMTLTHGINTGWADSSTDKPAHNGLTDFGKDVVREMNRLGVIVDISHVADKTFYDALAVSQAPMIASHSSCRALCNAARNMTDDMIKALASKGGVMQINYHIGFLSQEYRDASDKFTEEEKKASAAELKKRCGENESCSVIEGEKMSRQLVAEGKLPRVSWEKIIDHIDHAVKLAGADHVGLGSDFDGANMPFGMEDATHVPQITQALLDRGYSESDIQKILGGNTLRVMQEVEAAARRLGGPQ
jgi:membrane dipeptidase